MRTLVFSLSFMFFFGMTQAQTEFPLYSDSIPNSKNAPDEERSSVSPDSILIIEKVSRPTLTVYTPVKQRKNQPAVVLCPGGGYWVLAAGHEGVDVAKRLNEMGLVVFLLKYRIPNDQTMVNREIGALQDAQRAIQFVRENAKKYSVNPDRIGIMGFSAGGHLASTASTHFDRPVINNSKGTSLRPDFSILVYPVISFNDSIGHLGSREQLLGKTPSDEKIRYYSNELQVNNQTPPAFLIHAKDDKTVVVQNSELYYEALKKFQPSSELYLYERGDHGFGMLNKTSDVKWMDVLEKWLKRNKWVK